ncbi:hypothetical protein F5Y12DRAFT_717744 [Xylaria sp. FL1777]|nr:hypothetical protein F5Y12DRAFT_717744 [Xylaria sp. FL1777]
MRVTESSSLSPLTTDLKAAVSSSFAAATIAHATVVGTPSWGRPTDIRTHHDVGVRWVDWWSDDSSRGYLLWCPVFSRRETHFHCCHPANGLHYKPQRKVVVNLLRGKVTWNGKLRGRGEANMKSLRRCIHVHQLQLYGRARSRGSINVEFASVAASGTSPSTAARLESRIPPKFMLRIRIVASSPLLFLRFIDMMPLSIANGPAADNIFPQILEYGPASQYNPRRWIPIAIKRKGDPRGETLTPDRCLLGNMMRAEIVAAPARAFALTFVRVRALSYRSISSTAWTKSRLGALLDSALLAIL